MNVNIEPAIGTRVAILSSNGTGRVTGHGTVTGSWNTGTCIYVTKGNGRTLGIHPALVRVA